MAPRLGLRCMDHGNHPALFSTSFLGSCSTIRRNREEPIGYKLSFVQFDGNGSPTEPANSSTAAVDIVSNPDLSACPRSCFRPVGLAWDSQGRLFMSSDSTGEIYVVTKENGTGVADVREASPNGSSPSSTGSGSAPSSTGSDTNKAVRRWSAGRGSYWVAGAAVVGALPMI